MYVRAPQAEAGRRGSESGTAGLASSNKKYISLQYYYSPFDYLAPSDVAFIKPKLAHISRTEITLAFGTSSDSIRCLKGSSGMPVKVRNPSCEIHDSELRFHNLIGKAAKCLMLCGVSHKLLAACLMNKGYSLIRK